MSRKKRRKNKDLKCPFTDKSEVNYKDVYKLKKFITTRGRILPPSRTGVCYKCQKQLAKEIKKARYMALLPYCKYS